MASMIDLDGLALSKIAENLPLKAVVALASVCRHFHSVLADEEENVGFWKRVASEVWGVVGVDDPDARPRLPGGAGAGAEASSWKETCVAHSKLLSRFGRDAGTRAASAWHRIEAALADVAPEVLSTLAPGRTFLSEKSEEGIHPEVLAAAALHNGQEDAYAVARPPPDSLLLQDIRRSQLGLFGSAVVYGEGFSRWLIAAQDGSGYEIRDRQN